MSSVRAYSVSSDIEKLDLDVIHAFLTESYWAKGIPKAVVEKSIQNSVCFGVYDAEGKQVAFARAVTDKATFAYLADVFVLEAHRGQGISKMMLDAYVAHPDLQGLRRHMLATSDAHGLYKKYGLNQLANRRYGCKSTIRRFIKNEL